MFNNVHCIFYRALFYVLSDFILCFIFQFLIWIGCNLMVLAIETMNEAYLLSTGTVDQTSLDRTGRPTGNLFFDPPTK